MNAERQHKCPVCGRGLASKRALQDHHRDRHAEKPNKEATVLGPRPNGTLLHVGRLRGPRVRKGLGMPGTIAPSSLGVQVPELTHKLSLEDRLFIDNYLNPCDERMGPSSGSKIPDGSLPNSGINGFREVINVAPPFPVTVEPGPIGGPVWSLIVMKLPMIREAIYLIATNSRDDLSPTDQVAIANVYNAAGVPIFPNWGDVVPGNSNLRISRVVWSQLKAITDLGTLFKQVRITKSGYTTFHNTPDLYNQGIVVTAQWNLDNSPRGLSAVTSTEPVSGFVDFPISWTTNGGGFLTAGTFSTPTGMYPMVPTSTPSITSSIATLVIPVDTLGLVGSIGFDANNTIPLEVDGSLMVEIHNDGQALNIVVTAVTAAGVMNEINRSVTSIASGSVNLGWAVLSLRTRQPGTDIELPPLDTQTIVQSTPKAVILPMKQYNGAYSVLRAWEPVFEMQEAENLGPVQWSRRNVSAPFFNNSDRDPDLIDLNFGTSVQAIMGISLAASVTIKIIQDIEFVAGEDSPWQGFMNPNVNVDTQVIPLARAISLGQPFAFPQTYNSMGTLLDGVESLLSHIPIIGQAVPLVSKVVRGLFPSTGADNTPHPEIKAGDISSLVTQLLQALGLGK